MDIFSSVFLDEWIIVAWASILSFHHPTEFQSSNRKAHSLLRILSIIHTYMFQHGKNIEIPFVLHRFRFCSFLLPCGCPTHSARPQITNHERTPNTRIYSVNYALRTNSLRGEHTFHRLALCVDVGIDCRSPSLSWHHNCPYCINICLQRKGKNEDQDKKNTTTVCCMIIDLVESQNIASVHSSGDHQQLCVCLFYMRILPACRFRFELLLAACRRQNTANDLLNGNKFRDFYFPKRLVVRWSSY